MKSCSIEIQHADVYIIAKLAILKEQNADIECHF